MAIFEIYYGKEKPITASGKHEVKLLRFAYEHKCWHYITMRGPAEKRAIKNLARKGYFEIQGDRFRFTYPTH